MSLLTNATRQMLYLHHYHHCAVWFQLRFKRTCMHLLSRPWCYTSAIPLQMLRKHWHLDQAWTALWHTPGSFLPSTMYIYHWNSRRSANVVSCYSNHDRGSWTQYRRACVLQDPTLTNWTYQETIPTLPGVKPITFAKFWNYICAVLKVWQTTILDPVFFGQGSRC